MSAVQIGPWTEAASEPASNLDEVISGLELRLNERDGIRDQAVEECRKILHLARVEIQGIHRGEDVTPLLQETRRRLLHLRGWLCGYPDLFSSGFGREAMQEATEALCVHAFIAGGPLPDPREIGVSDTAYLDGLGDVPGEMRREALRQLRAHDLESAFRYLDFMERILDALMRFVYPDQTIIKHKQDVARTLIEATRGELAVASQHIELAKKLEAVRACLQDAPLRP